ncbi:hypothetical protein RCL1_001817 [Eukaryota sp. TZLM3-RCL]
MSLDRPLCTLLLRNTLSDQIDSIPYDCDLRDALRPFLLKFSLVSQSFRSLTLYAIRSVLSFKSIAVPLNDAFSAFLSKIGLDSPNLSLIVHKPSFKCPFDPSSVTSLHVSAHEKLDLTSFCSSPSFPQLSTLKLAYISFSSSSLNSSFPFLSPSLRSLSIHNCLLDGHLSFNSEFNQISDLSIKDIGFMTYGLAEFDLSNLIGLVSLEIFIDTSDEVVLRGMGSLINLKHISFENINECDELNGDTLLLSCRLIASYRQLLNNLLKNADNFKNCLFDLEYLNLNAIIEANPELAKIMMINRVNGLSFDNESYLANISFENLTVFEVFNVEDVTLDLSNSKFLSQISISTVDNESTEFVLPENLETHNLRLSAVTPKICSKFLQACRLLRRLDLAPSKILEQNFDWSRHHESIKFDYLSRFSLGSSFPVNLFEFPRLKVFESVSNDFDFNWLITKFPKLVELSLFYCKLICSSPFPLSTCHPLFVLKCHYVSLCDFDLSSFSSLTNVTIAPESSSSSLCALSLPSCVKVLTYVGSIDLLKFNIEQWKQVGQIKASCVGNNQDTCAELFALGTEFNLVLDYSVCSDL